MHVVPAGTKTQSGISAYTKDQAPLDRTRPFMAGDGSDEKVFMGGLSQEPMNIRYPSKGSATRLLYASILLYVLVSLRIA